MSLFLVLQNGKYDCKDLQAFLALLGPPTLAMSTSLSMESQQSFLSFIFHVASLLKHSPNCCGKLVSEDESCNQDIFIKLHGQLFFSYNIDCESPCRSPRKHNFQAMSLHQMSPFCILQRELWMFQTLVCSAPLKQISFGRLAGLPLNIFFIKSSFSFFCLRSCNAVNPKTGVSVTCICEINNGIVKNVGGACILSNHKEVRQWLHSVMTCLYLCEIWWAHRCNFIQMSTFFKIFIELWKVVLIITKCFLATMALCHLHQNRWWNFHFSLCKFG